MTANGIQIKQVRDMKNLPKKIYLQIGGSDVTIDESITDWNDLFHGAITWADHRINNNDIEFVLSDVVGQSEQLVAFGIWLDKNDKHLENGNITETVQDFLKGD
jgi:hypothetical protein